MSDTESYLLNGTAAFLAIKIITTYYFLCMIMEIRDICLHPNYPSWLGYNFYFFLAEENLFARQPTLFPFKAEKMLMIFLGLL